MPTRTRTRNLRQTVVGTISNPTGGVLVTSNPYPVGLLTKTDDFVGNRSGVNDFSCDHDLRVGGLLSGTSYQPDLVTPQYVYNDYPMGLVSEVTPNPVSVFPMSTFRASELAWKLLADTNPGAPEISVPQFIGELKDVPSLVRDWGRGIIKDTAKAHLTYRWAWLPLLNDLKSMLNFQDLCQKRFKELDKLRKGVSLGKRKRLDGSSREVVGSQFVANSIYSSLQGRWYDTYTEKVWGSVQWYLPNWSWLRTASDDEMLSHTKKMLAGFTAHNAIATSWELLPWSWLVDWFSSVGNMVTAGHNSIDCAYHKICIMQHLTLRREFRQTVPWHPRSQELRYTPVIRTREVKRRFANPLLLFFPTLRLPILNDRKLSIIVALAALRLPQSRR